MSDRRRSVPHRRPRLAPAVLRPRLAPAVLRPRLAPAVLAGVLLAAAACDTQSPLERLRTQLERYPEYSVILQDMDDRGWSGYWHQYRVIAGEPRAGSDELVHRESIRDWQQVDSGTYERYRPSLGMVILSKGADGAVDGGTHPPGYQQVGDERYGRWRDDGGGRSFWEFYGQYALLSNLVGGFGRPIYRDDWNGYQDARRRGETWYGPGSGGAAGRGTAGGGAAGRGGRAYGTNGSTTRQTSPDFFRRQQEQQAAQSRSFGQRVTSRMSGGMRSFGK